MTAAISLDDFAELYLERLTNNTYSEFVAWMKTLNSNFDEGLFKRKAALDFIRDKINADKKENGVQLLALFKELSSRRYAFVDLDSFLKLAKKGSRLFLGDKWLDFLNHIHEENRIELPVFVPEEGCSRFYPHSPFKSD